LRRVEEVLATEPAIVDAAETTPLTSATGAEVTFEDVSFAYGAYDGETSEAVLHELSLSAKPGQMLAILGATGVGKTTLVNLIPRLYDVTKGAVRVQGVDVRRLKQTELLDRLAIVPQEALLFAGTVRDNLAYGKPHASDAELEAAAKAAQAHDFISQLPEGYGATVAPRGANFSGGQRQRLCIARALVLQAPILILDDSTSAVDIATEAKIQDAIRGAQGSGTLFVVAQRISSVLRADRILVLEHGRIVAQGTHAELLQSSPVYREIYDSQLGAGARVEP